MHQMNHNTTDNSSSEKQVMRGHNLDMRVAADQFRMNKFEFMQN